MTTALEDFANTVRQIIGREGETTEAIWSIGPHLQQLAARPDIGARIRDAGRGAPLYRDPDGAFVLGRAQFDAGHVTPVHSHGGWGLLCLLSGEDRYTSWRRVDTGLRLVHDHHLRPGDLAHWFNPPYNIHRQAAGPDGTTELVLHKGDGRRVEHFDLDTGAARPAPPPRSSSDAPRAGDRD